MRKKFPILALSALALTFSGCSSPEALPDKDQKVPQAIKRAPMKSRVAVIPTDPRNNAGAEVAKSKRGKLGKKKTISRPKKNGAKLEGYLGGLSTRGRGPSGGGTGISTNSLHSPTAKRARAQRRQVASDGSRVKYSRKTVIDFSDVNLPRELKKPGGNYTEQRAENDEQEKQIPNSKRFKHEGYNEFVDTAQDKLSTFAIDVDTASYTYAKNELQHGGRPYANSVRVEEWVNAFEYDYAGPRGKTPFAIHVAGATSPYDKNREILRVGIQGKAVSEENRKPTHLVFLVDVSGSMSRANKLPLVQKSLHLLVDELRPQDSIALITYASGTREALSAIRTTETNKKKIHGAIDSLRSGGGTAMGAGLELAYKNAHRNLKSGNISRVIVLSDGDANIGTIGHKPMLEAVKGLVSEGVKISTVGFGMGNYRDNRMEQLANMGDGNYSYVNNESTARRIFVRQMTGTLQVIAKDVKIQVEFDPQVVKSYRLIGYENRDVADKDFRNDKVDAGEIGAGHTVTALYEIERSSKATGKFGVVRVRYKKPRGQKAKEVAMNIHTRQLQADLENLDHNTRFAVAVAMASEKFRESPYAANLGFHDVVSLAKGAISGLDKDARAEFLAYMKMQVANDVVSKR